MAAEEDSSLNLNRLPETNIAPENGWLEYDSFLLGWPVFRGELLIFREGSQSQRLLLFGMFFVAVTTSTSTFCLGDPNLKPSLSAVLHPNVLFCCFSSSLPALLRQIQVDIPQSS